MSTSNVSNLVKANAVKPIYSITPFTLLDYPDKTACIVWFAGCNMRCLYCYNPDIVLGKGKLSFQDLILFLKSRVNLLDGVVLSGGECTLQKNLFQLIQEIKKLGLLVKIDTNGSNPKTLALLIKEKLLDYVALDFKAPHEKFKYITKVDYYSQFIATLKLLIASAIPFEVRTTYHSSLLALTELQQMIAILEKHDYRGVYYIQNFRNDTRTLSAVANSEPNTINNAVLKANFKVALRNF